MYICAPKEDVCMLVPCKIPELPKKEFLSTLKGPVIHELKLHATSWHKLYVAACRASCHEFSLKDLETVTS